MGAYRNVRLAAQDLASGRVIAPGEVVLADDVDLDDPHDAALVADGLLIEADVPEVDKPLSGAALKERAAELDIDGRAKMSADELRAAIEVAEQDAAADAGGDDNDTGGDS